MQGLLVLPREMARIFQKVTVRCLSDEDIAGKNAIEA